jgi:TIR domain
MSHPEKSKPNFLRLVGADPQPDALSEKTFARPAWQSTLFATENPTLVVFVNVERIEEADLITVLRGSRPKTVFDLRRVPRFDIGNLNRRIVFSLFAELSAQYVDLSTVLLQKDGRDTRANPSAVTGLVLQSQSSESIKGPVAFLVNADQFGEDYISPLLEALPSELRTPWDVLRVPANDQTIQEGAKRTLVFISHANPEENVFATWLTQQLALLGYDVRSDVAQLVGGELFWEDIEKAIRHQAAKVVVVLSKAAQLKAGVLDEIDLAVRVERSNSLQRFVLPIRVDDLPYDQIRANLGRKAVIDFSANWASGLHALVTVLERDQIPRTKAGIPTALSLWISHHLGESSRLANEPEQLTSNWLSIKELPQFIRLYDISVPIERIATTMRSFRYPCFRYLRLIGSFSELSGLQQDIPPTTSLSEVYRIDANRFLAGTASELPGMPSREAHKIVTSMLRQSWDYAMEKRGLRSFATASGALAWYMPKGFLDGDKVSFVDDAGKRRRKLMVGWSERRKVFWHFAVEARPVLGAHPRFVLRQHVIFTADGSTPLVSKERMHLLRRRFCKNWWNDRWRDLLIGFVTWLGSNDGDKLFVGENETITLERSLMVLKSPVSIVADGSNLSESLLVDGEDELDSGDDIEAFDDIPEVWTDEGQETAKT